MARIAIKRPSPSLPAHLLERVAKGERVTVRRGRKAVAAVVSLEDRLDNEAADAALREPGPNIPLTRLKAKLGLK
jgi:antitoxin (DNA-binding transcriptional repressor) of toxin-antitoxin stability system